MFNNYKLSVFFHRKFFFIICKLISLANFYKITKKCLAYYKSRNYKKKTNYLLFLTKMAAVSI